MVAFDTYCLSASFHKSDTGSNQNNRFWHEAAETMIFNPRLLPGVNRTWHGVMRVDGVATSSGSDAAFLTCDSPVEAEQVFGAVSDM